VFRNRELFNYRTPFLDTDLVDFMLTIPPDLRYKQKLYRSMLIKRYPHLFTLPTKNNLGLGLNASYSSLFLMRSTSYLKMQTNALMHIFSDQNIFQNKNDNYMNYDELLRNNEEYNMIIKKFLSKLQKRDFFNCNFIEDIWRLHMKGDKNYSMLFGLLATFELFLSNYVDKK
jgi:asparagine synthase (glutamine-hydrolysing)